MSCSSIDKIALSWLYVTTNQLLPSKCIFRV